MTTIADISSVAYKKGNWMRYLLWGLGVVCIGALIVTFVTAVNGEISAAVPPDYRFAVANTYGEGSRVRTTYYIYDDHIIVEDEGFENGEVNRSVMIYDDVNTKGLQLNSEDTTEICELGSCKEHPKVLATIKSLLSRKVGREYIGL